MMNTNDRNLFAIFSLGQEDIAYMFIIEKNDLIRINLKKNDVF